MSTLYMKIRVEVPGHHIAACRTPDEVRELLYRYGVIGVRQDQVESITTRNIPDPASNRQIIMQDVYHYDQARDS